jgi:hypothetical protein
LNPKQFRKFISNKVKVETLKNKMFFITHGANVYVTDCDVCGCSYARLMIWLGLEWTCKLP